MWTPLPDKEVKRLLELAVAAGESEIAQRIKLWLDENALHADKQAAFRNYAKVNLDCDGEVEFDSDAVVSLSEYGGAYVMGWVWVSEGELEPDPLD